VITLSEIALKIKTEKSVAIISHVRPDGDTIGSACALKLALDVLSIKAEVFCEDAIPARFSFLSIIKQIQNKIIGSFSAIIAIDCADLMRLGNFAEDFSTHKNTYNIDHHVSNTRYAKTNFVLDTASNCENIYNLINELGVKITTDIANCLVLGVMTDTGGFRHKNVTSQTFLTVSKLVGYGADVNKIYYHMFTAQSKNRAKLFGTVMSKIRYFYDDRLAIVTVFSSDIKESCARPDETEGFIDFVMGIETVEIGACLLETDKNVYKVSFRSKSADVNAVAGTFGGGGHTLASGCRIYGEYEDVIEKITFAVSRELPDCL